MLQNRPSTHHARTHIHVSKYVVTQAHTPGRLIFWGLDLFQVSPFDTFPSAPAGKTVSSTVSSPCIPGTQHGAGTQLALHDCVLS